MNGANLTDPLLPELETALEKARVEFGAGGDWLPSKWLDELLATARQTDDWKFLTDSITQQLQQLESWRDQLQKLLTDTAAVLEQREQRDLYTPAWWRRKRKLVDEAFRAGKEEGVARLLAIYAEALNAWALDVCFAIASETYPLEVGDDTLETLRSGTQAITSGNYPHALFLLGRLVANTTLDPELRANLTVFAGRIYLRQEDQRPRALEIFEFAKSLAPQSGKPYAALAQYWGVSGDLNQAEQFCHQSLELSPQLPDAFIELGLLAETKQDWDEADDYYSQAIETVRSQPHPLAALSKMLAPLSGNFYLQLARKWKTQNPAQALEAVNRAISAGVKLEGDYPERVAYRIQGEILETLDKKVEAADAFFEAGTRFVYRNENEVAVDLLDRARQLNPEHPFVDWYLADALYVTSWVAAYPYVREEPLRRGIQVWDQRIARSLPSADYAWVYITRANFCSQEAQLPSVDRYTRWWESAAYLERSALLSESAAAYAQLAYKYRLLNKEANALEVTRKAIELDAENLNALDERAGILANTGQLEEAEAILEKRRKIAPNEWTDAVKAYVLSRQDKFEEALELMNSVIDKNPTEPWYRDLRALINRRLKRPEDARQDYTWLRKHYAANDSISASYFGTAAFYLGEVDEAIGIFEKLLEDPSQDPVSIYESLAEAYLKKADFAKAEFFYGKCISGTINQRQLNDLVKAFAILREDSQQSPDAAKVEEVLARCEQQIAERRRILGQPQSAIEQMKTVLAQASPGTEIAASAALGRLYQWQQRWGDALVIYERLQKDPSFPEARLAVERINALIQTPAAPMAQARQ